MLRRDHRTRRSCTKTHVSAGMGFVEFIPETPFRECEEIHAVGNNPRTERSRNTHQLLLWRNDCQWEMAVITKTRIAQKAPVVKSICPVHVTLGVLFHTMTILDFFFSFSSGVTMILIFCVTGHHSTAAPLRAHCQSRNQTKNTSARQNSPPWTHSPQKSSTPALTDFPPVKVPPKLQPSWNSTTAPTDCHVHIPLPCQKLLSESIYVE